MFYYVMLRMGPETVKRAPGSTQPGRSQAKKEWVAMSTAMAYAPNREALASTLKGVEVKAQSLVSRIRVAGNRS